MVLGNVYYGIHFIFVAFQSQIGLDVGTTLAATFHFINDGVRRFLDWGSFIRGSGFDLDQSMKKCKSKDERETRRDRNRIVS